MNTKDNSQHNNKITKSDALRKELEDIVNGDGFFINDISFDKASFTLDYNVDAGCFKGGMSFEGLRSNIEDNKGHLAVFVELPRFTTSSKEKKDAALAIKVLDVPFRIDFNTIRAGTLYASATVPGNKISDEVIKKVGEACNQAMATYNKEHVDLIEGADGASGVAYYPYNYFLDNGVGTLNLIYKENAGRAKEMLTF